MARGDTDSLVAALRFAHESGVWIVRGEAEAVATGSPPDSGPTAPGLARIREDLGDCHRCRLWEGRSHIVFGVGNPHARLLFVGEAPGAEEDRRGEPFVGRAGQLLDRMIQAIGLTRADVYIANVLKCRPPRNRDPNADEVETCIPFLWRQIDAIRPRVICALGNHAARNLLGQETAISSLRGRLQKARGWSVVPTYHPAYLLRNPRAKRQAWHDLKLVRQILEDDG